VAVIAVAEEAQQAQGFCYSSTATLVYVSKESGERIPLNTEPILGEHAHSLMEPCEVVHTKMLGRAVLEAWELIPPPLTENLVTVAAERRYLKQLFRQFDHLKCILEYRAFEKVLDPYDNHSLGEVHVRLAGTAAGKLMEGFIEVARGNTERMLTDALTEKPEEQLVEYNVFTDCSFRSTHNKKYSRGGRMGIAGVSEDGFYFHTHDDAVNIMTGELSAMLTAFHVFYTGGRRLVINTDSLGALTFVLRLAHSRWSFERWAREGIQDERVITEMTRLTEAIRSRRVIVKHVPGHTGHGLQESSDSVSKMHRHFRGQGRRGAGDIGAHVFRCAVLGADATASVVFAMDAGFVRFQHRRLVHQVLCAVFVTKGLKDGVAFQAFHADTTLHHAPAHHAP